MRGWLHLTTRQQMAGVDAGVRVVSVTVDASRQAAAGVDASMRVVSVRVDAPAFLVIRDTGASPHKC